MPAKYLRSGPYEDTPIEEVPDGWLKDTLKALGGVGHPFSKVEERMIRDEYNRRFAAEDARRVAEANAAAAARTAEEMAPVFNPPGGEFDNPVTLSFSVGVPGARVFYTTNGEDPDGESTLFSGAVTIAETTTIKAVSVIDKSGRQVVSAVKSADYVVKTKEEREAEVEEEVDPDFPTPAPDPVLLTPVTPVTEHDGSDLTDENEDPIEPSSSFTSTSSPDRPSRRGRR